jgi:cysteinyl-tRNA synthetase
MHNGFVKINAEKMSKSLGNIFPIREILKIYHPEVLRLFMLQSHYRSPVDYSESSLAETRSGLVRCYTTLQLLKETMGKPATSAAAVNEKNSTKQKEYISKIQELKEKFDSSLDDDFNTAQSLGYVFEVVRLTNNFIALEKNMPAALKTNIFDETKKAFDHFGAVLGVFQDDPDHFFKFDREIEVSKRGLNIGEIESLITERQAARAAKDWTKADAIRQELAGLHVVLKDTANTTSWIIE